MQSLKILVLDDDENRLKLFNMKYIGNAVTCVRTAAEAIGKLATEVFDVVMLDHDLGGQTFQASGPGTGYEVAKWLSENPDRKPNQIIIHSFNPAGAKNMQEVLPGSDYQPGIWVLNEVNLN